MGTVVAEPYAALTTVRGLRPVQPHNSVRGLHYCTMGATLTHASTLLMLLVWRPRQLQSTHTYPTNLLHRIAHRSWARG